MSAAAARAVGQLITAHTARAVVELGSGLFPKLVPARWERRRARVGARSERFKDADDV